MRHSVSEWELCLGKNGEPLPYEKCMKYRSAMQAAGVTLRPVKRAPANTRKLLPDQSKKQSPPLEQNPLISIAIVIPCCNYGHWLSGCIESALAQTLRPAEILVVDDSSTDNTREVAISYADRGVKYLRVDHRHVHRAREAGLRATTSPWLCFLDADDVLDAGYLAAAASHFSSSDVGVITTDIYCFGEATDVRRYDFDINVRNWLHAASVVRRGALDLAEVFNSDTPCQSHADWYMWRKVLNYGFRAVRSDGIYRYRVHSGSMLQRAVREDESYRVQAALDLETVSLVLPLSGRREWWPRLRRWVETQNWPLSRLHVLVTDTGPDDWSREIRQWLATLDCAGTSYLRLPDTNGLADAERANSAQTQATVGIVVPRLYQRALQHASTPYVFTVEDDILPPLDAISRLMDSMAPDVAAVAGIYRGRYAYPYCILPQPAKFGHGVEEITASGFGCLLLRRFAWQQTVLTNSGDCPWYDWNFGPRLNELGWKYKLDWSVECMHQSLPARSVPEAQKPLTLAQKALNYGASMMRHATNGFQVASAEEIQRRLSICEQCPKFVANTCQACGCSCSSNRNALTNKLASASAKCPHPDGARW